MNAELNSPVGLAVDRRDNIFIVDRFNYRIRRVSKSGIIETVAGSGLYGLTGDGFQATNAYLGIPIGITVDESGNLFFADFLPSVVREVNLNGIISTVAGDKYEGFTGDGGVATNSSLQYPSAVAVDGDNHLFIADTGNNRIRKVALSETPTFTLDGAWTGNTGSYWVVISNLYGSFTSSVAFVQVVPQPFATDLSARGDGSMVLDAVTGTNVSSRVWAATNLTPPIAWVPVYTNAIGGTWQFTDTNTMANTSRFYRISTP